MSEIRKAFTSRFPEGRLLELDFSQLEIYVLAHLSNDKQLKADLLSGADLHGISATNLFGSGYTPKQRKIAKQLSFQLQYGAGAKSMAESNGIQLSVAKRFIEQYYDRYKGVKTWQTMTLSTVMTNREQSTLRTTSGNPAGISTLKSETGRRYTFVEQDSPDWSRGADTSFSPTQIKNYPVQGLATADIVPMILGKLYRELKSWKIPPLMVNTVHDSVLFDCTSKQQAATWARTAKQIMEEAPKYLKEIFNIDFTLPLPVEASIGEDWYDMTPLAI